MSDHYGTRYGKEAAVAAASRLSITNRGGTSSASGRRRG
jgi:hypothetical protein